MFTTVRLKFALYQRAKLLITGVATSAQPVGTTQYCYRVSGLGRVCVIAK